MPATATSFAAHFFAAPPDAPYVRPFRDAARLVAGAATPADLRDASDALGGAALAVGLDRWRGFLRGVDERIAGSPAPLVVLARAAGPVGALGEGPGSVRPGPERDGTGKALGLAAAAVALTALVGVVVANATREDIRQVAGRFGLDLDTRAGQEAAAAFLHVRTGNAAVLAHLGADKVDREAAAEAVLQAVRARPELLQDALGGVASGALDAVREAVRSAVADPVTESAEEENLKDAWRKAGLTNGQIAAGLENLRERRKHDASGVPAADGRRPPAWIPAEVVMRLPERFGLGRETDKGGGWRWADPFDRGNTVRIDPAVPGSEFPSQRVAHVVVVVRGKVIGRDGAPIKGSIKNDSTNAHIPLTEYVRWRSWIGP